MKTKIIFSTILFTLFYGATASANKGLDAPSHAYVCLLHGVQYDMIFIPTGSASGSLYACPLPSKDIWYTDLHKEFHGVNGPDDLDPVSRKCIEEVPFDDGE